MRTSTWLLLGGVGVLGFLWWKSKRPPMPQSARTVDALTQGLQAGIAAGTYDAQALRMSNQDSALISSGAARG